MGFPLKASQRDRVGNGWYVNSEVTLGDNGRLYGMTILENRNNALGFKAGCVILLGDSNDNLLWRSKIHKTGVNASGLRKKRTKKLNWDEEVPSDIVQRTTKLTIISKKTPDEHLWKQRIDEGIDITKKVAAVAKEIA